jgi:hypothetical protein
VERRQSEEETGTAFVAVIDRDDEQRPSATA